MDDEIKIFSVAAGFFVDKGKIFVAKRRADDEDGSKWEFPGGVLKDDETFDDALKREFKEEFNVDIDVVEEVGGAEFQKNEKMYVITFFLVTGDFNSIQIKAHQEVKFVPFDELAKLDLSQPDRDFINNFQTEIKRVMEK